MNLEQYTHLIKRTSKNYTFINIGEIEKFKLSRSFTDNKKVCFLRHDIDFSLEDAMAMANIEKEMDIKTNYFFMLSSNTYNAISLDSQRIIKEIGLKGHTISLHFDPTVYEDLDL